LSIKPSVLAPLLFVIRIAKQRARYGYSWLPLASSQTGCDRSNPKFNYPGLTSELGKLNFEIPELNFELPGLKSAAPKLDSEYP
jgi:hypothetical protein